MPPSQRQSGPLRVFQTRITKTKADAFVTGHLPWLMLCVDTIRFDLVHGEAHLLRHAQAAITDESFAHDDAVGHDADLSFG